jgi:transcriptional regulator with XRE-family HTH domain
MDLVAVGARIRQARENRGLTQAGLAAEVGVSRSAVAQWETGRSGQVGATLAVIARVLGVGVEHLLLGGAGQVAGELGVMDSARGDELALLRLYRACLAEDRAVVLRLLRRLAKVKAGADANIAEQS